MKTTQQDISTAIIETENAMWAAREKALMCSFHGREKEGIPFTDEANRLQRQLDDLRAQARG